MYDKLVNTDEFISKYPEDVKAKLNQIRSLVKKIEPEAREGMAYGVPSFKLDGRNFFMYAAFKNHVGIYPTPIIIESFKKDLIDYETSKGTIKFPLNEPLPLPLIAKIVKACANEEFMAVE